MKKVIATLLAAALIVPGAAQAQNRDPNERPPSAQQRAPSAQQARQNDNDRGRQQAAPALRKRQPQVHRFTRGERFDRSRATNYSRIDYRQYRKLSAPGRNQVWVRSGSDALLVLLSNNMIQRVVRGAF